MNSLRFIASFLRSPEKPPRFTLINSNRLIREAASCGLDVYFDTPNVRYDCGDWRCEVQFKSVAQVIESLIFCGALTGNIDVDALGDVPFAFLPDASGE